MTLPTFRISVDVVSMINALTFRISVEGVSMINALISDSRLRFHTRINAKLMLRSKGRNNMPDRIQVFDHAKHMDRLDCW